MSNISPLPLAVGTTGHGNRLNLRDEDLGNSFSGWLA
jgi:hypothetical protein